MESVALFTPAQLRELFFETAARKRMTPSIVEKDFWVCWTLGKRTPWDNDPPASRPF